MEGKNKEPPKIRVVIRKRPLFGKEVTRNDKDIMTVVGESSLLVQEMKEKLDLTKYIEEHSFTFDNVFDADKNNEELYEECVKPLVSETFKGAKTTCFAYGQTGSGKTFTMMGTRDGSVSGMYTLAAYDIIYLIENCYDGLEVYISFYEIYCGELYDLLNGHKKVACREDAKQRVNIVNLTEKHVDSVEVIMDTIHEGLKARTSGKTGANEESSRSHAILCFSIKAGGKLFSKMSFIDLAGSERGADVIDNGKKRQQDGAEINKSLLALKECIRALDRVGKKGHLPFRGSKLTQVLKESFMGNSKTTMIANVSPALSCCEPTLNTLRYADRVKELKKDPSLKGKSDELMLARQAGNVRIIEIDQKTGNRKSDMADLARDFKPKMKSNINPDDMLAQMASRQNNKNVVSKIKSPRQNQIQAPSSRIGGGVKPSSTMNRPQSSANRQEQNSQRIKPQQNNFINSQTQNFNKNGFDQSQGGGQGSQGQTKTKNNLQEIMDIQDLDEQLQFDQFDLRDEDDGDFLLNNDNQLQELQGPTPEREDQAMDFSDAYDQQPDDVIEEFEIDEKDDFEDDANHINVQNQTSSENNSFIQQANSTNPMPQKQLQFSNQNRIPSQNLNQNTGQQQQVYQSRLKMPSKQKAPIEQHQPEVEIVDEDMHNQSSSSNVVNSFKQKLLQNNERKNTIQNQQAQDTRNAARNRGLQQPAKTPNQGSFAYNSRSNVPNQNNQRQDRKINFRESPMKKGYFGSMVDQVPNAAPNFQNRAQQSKSVMGQNRQFQGIKSHNPALQPKPQSYNAARLQQRGGPPVPKVKKTERLGDGVPTYDELKRKYQYNADALGGEHEKLIETILEEEEQLIFQHNTCCKKSIKIVEEEMSILKEVDKPGSDVQTYVENLDKILVNKIEMMTTLRKQLLDFYKNIKTEEQMLKLFHELQAEMDPMSDGDMSGQF